MKADKSLRTGFRLVEEYDPDLYARMEASAWHIEELDMLSMLAIPALGLTSTQHPLESAINTLLINDNARQMGVPGSYLLAAILVHEFVHTAQSGQEESVEVEIPALQAGAAFAARLPAPYGQAIKRGIDRVAAESIRNNCYPCYTDG